MVKGRGLKFASCFALAAGLLWGSPAMAKNAHDFAFEGIEGGPLPMSKFKGKVVLVVNTASFCGFTPQYEGLEQIFKEYQGRGLVVLGVPANNFGGQEPGTNAEIKEFCEAKYDVDFPLASKVSVKGGDAHPFYKWALETLGEDKAPQWNFHKYLVDARGYLVASFPTRVVPDAPEIKAAIDRAIAAK
ncbi:MAG: glutathione peroxidase [Rhodospirillaceae bacterium]|nr:glutathione peroxidase [Rhodospirillaceae bacterium]